MAESSLELSKTELDQKEPVITGVTSELLAVLRFFVCKIGVIIHILYISQSCFLWVKRRKNIKTLSKKVQRPLVIFTR